MEYSPLNLFYPELGVVKDWESDGSPKLDISEDEFISGRFTEVVLNVGQNLSLGVGILYLTSRRLVWKSAEQQGNSSCQIGYQIFFPQITMHAVCNDNEQYPQPCVYCQLGGQEEEQDDFHGIGNGSLLNQNGTNIEGSQHQNQILNEQENVHQDEQASEEDDARMDEVTEIFIVPLESQQVKDIFEKMCECASLNPDLDCEEEDGMFYDEEEVYNGLTEDDILAMIESGNLQEQELEQLMQEDPGRFDDPGFQ
eukprot:TRINITY_DN814_c0_g1_i4.p1 TRINITY_DN814_c0_g1~~TRINITY_DN814_c0_g1_i4.p1  ORF type:complete len:270 (+),score=37.96 TRINITY_DN814_c0_g1_i4:50-811(+)